MTKAAKKRVSPSSKSKGVAVTASTDTNTVPPKDNADAVLIGTDTAAAAPAKKVRRPKKTPATEPKNPANTEVDSAPLPGMATHIKLPDLWEMRLAQMEKRALLAEAEVARMTKLYALEKLDKKGIVLTLEKKMDKARKAAELAETRSLLAKKRMEGTIGRPLSNVSIDPDTGEVVVPK